MIKFRTLNFGVAIWMFALLFVSQAEQKTERVRVLGFDPKSPIESRLDPHDEVVVVEKDTFPPSIALNVGQTFDEAIDHALKHDTVVLAHGVVNGGTLIDGGTWIRGTVNASIIETIKSEHLNDRSPRLTFWHNDGELLIKNVRVKAGRYPIFDPSAKYLLLLGYDESRGLYLGRALRVTKEGILATVLTSTGETQLPTSALYGQPLEPVLAALRARKR
jgi:hypothetical protein